MLYKDYVERKTANAIRINSAEGYPCVFDNSKGRPLKDYKLYGKSIQDGMPSIENPIEVQSVGDLTTKNLFNYADYTTLTKYNGDDISANWLTIDGDLFYIKYDYYNGGCWLTPTKQWELSSGTYTLSGKCKDNTIKGNPNICHCGVRWSDDTKNTGWGKINSNDGEWYSFSYTFTISETKIVKGVYLQDNGAQKKSAICFTNIQLEEGSTATEYEPYHKYDIPIVVNDTTTHIYLDEPLRKVGSYADYIDFKRQRVVRNIVKHSLSVDSIYRKLNNVIRFTAVGPLGKLDYHMRSTIFRNYSEDWYNDRESIFHHPGTWYAYYWSVYWHRLGLTYDGTNVYRTDDTEQTPLTDSEIINITKKWLNTLSDKDREVYIILDTPTKKSTTLPALKTFKGTNIISVDTNISPSNIQVQYIEK